MGEGLQSHAGGGERGERGWPVPGSEETLTKQTHSLQLQEAIQPQSHPWEVEPLFTAGHQTSLRAKTSRKGFRRDF